MAPTKYSFFILYFNIESFNFRLAQYLGISPMMDKNKNSEIGYETTTHPHIRSRIGEEDHCYELL